MSNGGNGPDTFGKMGMFLFAASFVGTIIFFGYVVAINPGGIDSGLFDVPVKFSKAEADTRTTSWKDLSPENIASGAELYKINCNSCHSQTGRDTILARLEKGELKHGAKPLELYRTVRIGFEGQHRFDFIPEQHKWALIAFLRSKIPNAPDDSSSDWKNFLKNGMY